MTPSAIWTPEVLYTLLTIFVVALIFLWVLDDGEDDWTDPSGLPRVVTKENHGTKVVVSQAYFWEPVETAPLGCKVQLKTIPGGIATYGEVTERNRKHFSDWAPLPTTRKDKK